MRDRGFSARRIIEQAGDVEHGLGDAVGIVAGLGGYFQKGKELLDSTNFNRNQWRDSLIERETGMIGVLNAECLHVKDNDKIAETMLRYSFSLLELADKDMEKKYRAEPNPVKKVLSSFSENARMDDKKKFWLKTFEMQSDVLQELTRSDIHPRLRSDAAKMMLTYADIILVGLDNLVKGRDGSLLSNMGKISKYKEIHKEVNANSGSNSDKSNDNKSNFYNFSKRTGTKSDRAYGI